MFNLAQTYQMLVFFSLGGAKEERKERREEG
jgi:hypothetical protein